MSAREQAASMLAARLAAAGMDPDAAEQMAGFLLGHAEAGTEPDTGDGTIGSQVDASPKA